MTFRSYLTVVGPLAILLTIAPPVRAQGAIPPAIYDTTGTAWTYAIYLAVPWPKVDSLVKLERFHSAWRDRSIEMGCFLDHVFLIHQSGDEYNVLYATSYRSPRPLVPGSGVQECRQQAWEEIVPDSTLRAEIQAGRDYVNGDYKHYDRIWWVPYPN